METPVRVATAQKSGEFTRLIQTASTSTVIFGDISLPLEAAVEPGRPRTHRTKDPVLYFRDAGGVAPAPADANVGGMVGGVYLSKGPFS
jgi:hypothetical protein